jgi:hypothetical protein
MHEKVLRGGPADLRLRLPCITRPTGYIPLDLYIHCASLLVGYPPTPSFGGFGRARVFFLLINIIFLLFLIWLRFLNLNLSEVFLWEILLSIPMELFSSMSALYSIFVTLDCYCYVLLFCLFCDWFILFIQSSVRTSRRAYVAELSTHNPIYLLWGVTLWVLHVLCI